MFRGVRGCICPTGISLPKNSLGSLLYTLHNLSRKMNSHYTSTTCLDLCPFGIRLNLKGIITNIAYTCRPQKKTICTYNFECCICMYMHTLSINDIPVSVQQLIHMYAGNLRFSNVYFWTPAITNNITVQTK